MSGFSLADGLTMVGLGLLAAGLGALDWRVALIVCGSLLFGVGLLGIVRGKK
jgi:hypothetical protein